MRSRSTHWDTFHTSSRSKERGRYLPSQYTGTDTGLHEILTTGLQSREVTHSSNTGGRRFFRRSLIFVDESTAKLKIEGLYRLLGLFDKGHNGRLSVLLDTRHYPVSGTVLTQTSQKGGSESGRRVPR